MLKFLTLCYLLLPVFTHDLHLTSNKITSLLKPAPIPLTSPLGLFIRHHPNVTYEPKRLSAGLNCTDFNITDANNPLTRYLTYSGKSVNDFGIFDSCKQI